MSTEQLKGRLKEKATSLTTGTAPKTMVDDIKSFLLAHKDELAAAIPQHITIDRLNRIAVSAISRTPGLANCTRLSLIGGVVISSQLGLELNTPLGHAFLIPYRRNVKQGNQWVPIDEAQFQIGYQGIIDLAYRTGLYVYIDATSVYSNDEFDYEYGLNRRLKHKPTDEEPGDLIGVYAMYETKTGAKNFKYWPVAKIIAHARRYSKQWDEKEEKFKAKSAWADSFEGMAKVPVLKDLLKTAPKSIEFQRQLSLDGSTKEEIKKDMWLAKDSSSDNAITADYSVLQTEDYGEVPMSEEEKARIIQQEQEEALAQEGFSAP